MAASTPEEAVDSLPQDTDADDGTDCGKDCDDAAALDTGLCGAIDEAVSSGGCGVLRPGADAVRGRIADLGKKGRGVISKLKHRASADAKGMASSASLYDPSLYLCGDEGVLSDEEVDDDALVPASDLSDPDRTICVITTAALPWRTGTAVNPLLRALYLVRHQDECRARRSEEMEEGIAAEEAEESVVNEGGGSGGSVALVVPWLESKEDRIKVYGESNDFADGPAGVKQQEQWIRNYSAERCGMPSEARRLKMIFYPAFYLAGFGSIFPKVDLCNFVPRDLVDVAILEEPEHLNWFRMPNSQEKSTRATGESVGADAVEEGGPTQHDGASKAGQPNRQSTGENDALEQKVEVTISEDLTEVASQQPANPDKDLAEQRPHKQCKKLVEKEKLGWTHRFRFVVGIVHTNYEAYARGYGVGASLIAAPAIGAVSALTIRAHCHHVIKLSDTLPSFAPGKEVTCNVHGVRREFLEGSASDGAPKGSGDKVESEMEAPSPVYFIGKLVWAKGFDLMLELQEIYRKKTGDYFHVDIYGGGPDEKAIARAFHGRHHRSPQTRPPAAKEPTAPPSPVETRDLNAAAVFKNPNSLRVQSSRALERMRSLNLDRDDVVARYLSLGFEVNQMNGSATYVKESRKGAVNGVDGQSDGEEKNAKSPLDILGDLSGKSYDTGVKTSRAVYNIADSSIKNILNMSFSQLKRPLKHVRRKANAEEQDAARGKGEAGTAEEEAGTDGPRFVFDPPTSRYEWRRRPIPAKFPGVVDHVQLRDPRHKIFLNPSTSEVLCTTTAEALAMGKFAVIPRHPSNDFFLQFANCLAYDTLDECAERMAWAAENSPTELPEEERRRLTWEAATERLAAASAVTVAQARERAETGMDKTDARIAYWLSESGEKSGMVRDLFHRDSAGNGGGDGRAPSCDG